MVKKTTKTTVKAGKERAGSVKKAHCEEAGAVTSRNKRFSFH